MNVERMAELKDKLIHAKQLSEVMTFFLDHFGNDPAFIRLGDCVRHPFLEQIIAVIARQIFGKDVPTRDLLLTRLPEQHFVHGGCWLGGCVANVLYFEDVAVGLLAAAPLTPGAETKLARFTGKPIKPVAGKPSVN